MNREAGCPGKSISKRGLLRCCLTAGLILAQQVGAAEPAPARDEWRTLRCGGRNRSWLIHVPSGLVPGKAVPLVLVLHGAAMNARMMSGFSGMNAQAGASGFLAVYPNGTGIGGTFLRWNSGGIGPPRAEPDDVAFLTAVLDAVQAEFPVDRRRVYAAGMSNGAMMTYKLAEQLSGRIAAVAAVGGTLTVANPRPARPVPLIHFHGTDDHIVPWSGPPRAGGPRMTFLSVPDSIAQWRQACGLPARVTERQIPDQFEDGTRVEVFRYGPGRGRARAEVVLVKIHGGGHTWPGEQPPLRLIGRSTREISANRMIWDFFRKHPLP